MPLELRRQRNGRLRKSWYARYEVNGQRRTCNLNVRVAGTPPPSFSLRDEGDKAFERSRATAQARLDQLVEEAHNKQGSARLVEKLYEIKTGERIQGVSLKKLVEEWVRLPRRRKPSPRYLQHGKATLKRFEAFVKTQNSHATEIIHVTRPMVRLFMEAESARGISPKTWNDVLKLLKGTFRKLLPVGAINPWEGIPTREAQTIFRTPYTPDELKRIMAVAQDDDFIRPILVTAMCTAMRRGDCCLLKWSDVDLEEGFLTVKTGKTGARVDIPIFPMLREELLQRGQTTDGQSGERFVFPKQARMYQQNPDGITNRVKKILAQALAEPEVVTLSEVSPSELRRRGLAHLDQCPNTAKRERMRKVFEAYLDGKTSREAGIKAGVSQGCASNHLNEIEEAIGCRLVRGRTSDRFPTARLRRQPGLLRQERKEGKRDASIRDFHSFRVTWVTLALTAGMPLELVRKVTGHQTAEVVLQHYFHPNRESLRQAIRTAMPRLLTDAPRSPRDEMRKILEEMTPKTWERDRKQLLEMLSEA